MSFLVTANVGRAVCSPAMNLDDALDWIPMDHQELIRCFEARGFKVGITIRDGTGQVWTVFLNGEEMERVVERKNNLAEVIMDPNSHPAGDH
jgi:hypothetical protein